MVTSLISHEIRMKSPTIFKAPNPSVAINNFEGFDCRGGSEILRVFSAAGCMFFFRDSGNTFGKLLFYFLMEATHILISMVVSVGISIHWRPFFSALWQMIDLTKPHADLIKWIGNTQPSTRVSWKWMVQWNPVGWWFGGSTASH